MLRRKISGASWEPSKKEWVSASGGYFSWLRGVLADVVLMVMIGGQIYRVLSRSGVMADGLTSQAGFAVIECANAWVMVRMKTEPMRKL